MSAGVSLWQNYYFIYNSALFFHELCSLLFSKRGGFFPILKKIVLQSSPEKDRKTCTIVVDKFVSTCSHRVLVINFFPKEVMMKKNKDSAWSEFVFEDETWKEDSVKERQHAQIQAAVQNFLNRGRKIEILPPQPDRESRNVRADHWGGAYEEFDEVLTSLN